MIHNLHCHKLNYQSERVGFTIHYRMVQDVSTASKDNIDKVYYCFILDLMRYALWICQANYYLNQLSIKSGKFHHKQLHIYQQHTEGKHYVHHQICNVLVIHEPISDFIRYMSFRSNLWLWQHLVLGVRE